MKKDQIILLEDRGLISITGEDNKNFLQNIITNDVEKVSLSSTIFSGLFTPQGKYLFEFFLTLALNIMGEIFAAAFRSTFVRFAFFVCLLCSM